MQTFRKTAIILSVAFSLGVMNYIANAEETAKSAAGVTHAVIAHIVEAKNEIMHRDFIPPSEHIKAARAASKAVSGNPQIIKPAHEAIIQAQIKINKGDKAGATVELDKALELYKSLKAD